MLRKILDVFITKKFTQCKTLHTLKINLFEIQHNKNIGKLFPKYELLFLDQANSSSDPSQTDLLILRFPIPRASLPSLSSLSNFTLANWSPFLNTIFIRFFMFFTVFPILSYSHSNTHATTYIRYNKPYGKPIKFTIKLYVDHNTYGSKRLPIKKMSL